MARVSGERDGARGNAGGGGERHGGTEVGHVGYVARRIKVV